MLLTMIDDDNVKKHLDFRTLSEKVNLVVVYEIIYSYLYVCVCIYKGVTCFDLCQLITQKRN